LVVSKAKNKDSGLRKGRKITANRCIFNYKWLDIDCQLFDAFLMFLSKVKWLKKNQIHFLD
jgi:hypothetical protein